MQAHKYDLDILFADLKSQQKEILESPAVSQEYKDMLQAFDALELEEDYEYFMEQMFKLGDQVFSDMVILATSVKLAVQGKADVCQSYNNIARLYKSLKKMP